MAKIDGIYSSLPVAAQHLAVSAYGLYRYWLRFGPGFAAQRRAHVKRERYSTEEWHDWQQSRLIDLLRHAANNVPHYRDAWGPAEKKAAAAGRLEDLPLLEKEPLRAAPRRFLRQDLHPARTVTFHTSGSSGTPISTFFTVAEVRRSLALREARANRWAGVSFKQPRATFSGRIVEPDPESSGPFYRFNLVERQIYFSPFHLSPQNAPRYVEALRRHRPRWMTGYAVSYYLLARSVLDQELEVPSSIAAVITTSEKLTPEMREVIERAFRCRVFEEYSTVENVLYASECERRHLHLSPDVAVVEILREDGTPTEPGETGEVVATCLSRIYQPFIRYRLGDLATWSESPCACGRAMPVIQEVVGRVEDVVVGPDGREMVRFHGIFVDQPQIREGQIVQEAPGRIRARIVPGDRFGDQDRDDVIRRIQARLGSTVEVIVETVAEIPRTASGKFQAVVSLPDHRSTEE